MRFQETKTSCGAAAIRNVLKCFGQNVGEHRLRTLAGTDDDGTTEAGVMNCLDHLGFTSEVYETGKVGHAKAALLKYLKEGRPLIVAVDQDTHWATVVGMLGPKRYVVVDSERTVKNKKENGVHVLDIRGLLRRWRKPDGTMYAIAVSKK
jgi:ABC-type bacteriocin/lantibiotic exporter with double-glycine peptidase domain